MRRVKVLDASDLHLIELDKNGRIDGVHRKNFIEVSHVVQSCSSKAEKKEVLIKNKRRMRNSRIEGKVKVKKNDFTEIQHDVSRSASVA